MWLNPALRRHPEEARLLGHMLLAYGELELMVGECLGVAIGDRDDAFRMMFRIMGETSRVQAAGAVMRRYYVEADLGLECDIAIGAVEYCITIRNLFAHSHWADHEDGGLFFTNLQEPAKASETFDYWYRHVDVPILTDLAEYFDYAAECLQFIQHEFRVRSGQIRRHAFPWPKRRPRPKKHNPPEVHIPPWLDPGGRQRHIERTQEQAAFESQQKDKSEAQKPSQQERRHAAHWRSELAEARQRVLRLLQHPRR